ncbi:MAG: SU10 major capsid protein [Prosthecobacter sp.]
MLTEPNVPVKHEDLGDALVSIDPAKKPFTTMVPKGPKPKDTIFFDTIDKEDTARMGGVSDGSAIDLTTVEDPSANHGKIGGRIQVHQRTLGVGFITLSVTDPAGVPDWYVRGVVKKLSEVKGDMELTYQSSQESRDSTTVGGVVLSDLTRGVGGYVNDAAPVDGAAAIPAAYRTPSAQIQNIAGVSGFKKSDLDALVMGVHVQAGGEMVTLNGFSTPEMVARIQSFFTEFKAVDGEVPLSRYTHDGESETVKNRVTRYENSWGSVDIVSSLYLGGIRGYTGSAGQAGSLLNTATTGALTTAFLDAQGKPGLQVGMRVYGTGIPAGAYITAINANGQGFTISAAATADCTLFYFGEIVHMNLLDMKYWEQRPTLPPGHTELPMNGSGKNGFIRAIAGLRCTNPLRQARVITKASALS